MSPSDIRRWRPGVHLLLYIKSLAVETPHSCYKNTHLPCRENQIGMDTPILTGQYPFPTWPGTKSNVTTGFPTKELTISPFCCQNVDAKTTKYRLCHWCHWGWSAGCQRRTHGQRHSTWYEAVQNKEGQITAGTKTVPPLSILSSAWPPYCRRFRLHWMLAFYLEVCLH